MPRRPVVLSAVADAVAVVAFVALGRGAHDEGSAITGTIEIAAPFLIAAAIAWLVLRLWRDPDPVWSAGVPVWIVTVALGLALRNLVFDRGTALPFVIVTTGMLGLLLVGRRALVAWRRSGTIPRHERVGTPGRTDR